MNAFELHPRLAADCFEVGRFPLSRLLLLDDARYPWFVLVPQRAAIREIHALAPADRAQLLAESCALGESMLRAFPGDKLNLGALGNLVPQLHLHHIVRRSDDPAWPGPVWGHSPAVAYDAAARGVRLAALRNVGVDGLVWEVPA